MEGRDTKMKIKFKMPWKMWLKLRYNAKMTGKSILRLLYELIDTLPNEGELQRLDDYIAALHGNATKERNGLNRTRG